MSQSEMPLEQKLRQRRQRYQPEVKHVITVRLPGEVIRGEILRVIDPENVIVEMTGYALSQEHGYRKGDKIPCRYGRDEMGAIGWLAIPERELRAAARQAEQRHLAAMVEEPAPAPAVAAKAEAPREPAKKSGWWQRRVG